MIIVGYQGIGKSTVAGRNSGIIDLESGNFWVTIDGEKKRDPHWVEAYVNMAIHLSEQGFDVCMSSHKAVRDCLMQTNTKERIVAIIPSQRLKNEWIKRLKNRYDTTHLDKDYKAYMNAKECFTENIREINESGIPVYTLEYMDYDLKFILNCLIK